MHKREPANVPADVPLAGRIPDAGMILCAPRISTAYRDKRSLAFADHAFAFFSSDDVVLMTQETTATHVTTTGASESIQLSDIASWERCEPPIVDI